MRTVLVIQARTNSSRLPAKVLLPLAGKPLISRLIERVVPSKNVDEIVIAIPDSKSDDYLNRILINLGVKIFRGSENDLLDRYYRAATKYKADYILRIPADNPVPCASEIDRIISFHIEENAAGFSSNLAQVYNSGYPDGIGAEIFSMENLEKAWIHTSNDSEEREHVHLNFYNYMTKTINPNFTEKVKSPKCPANFARPDIVLDVNTLGQYLIMAKLYDELYSSESHFGIEEIISWHDSNFGVINERT